MSFVPCGDWGEAHEDAEPLCLWKRQGFSGHSILKPSKDEWCLSYPAEASESVLVLMHVASENTCLIRWCRIGTADSS